MGAEPSLPAWPRCWLRDPLIAGWGRPCGAASPPDQRSGTLGALVPGAALYQSGFGVTQDNTQVKQVCRESWASSFGDGVARSGT